MQTQPTTNIYQLCYSLDITYNDRQKKFTFASEWQDDEEVDECQDKNCQLKFTWFQRKHHCRK